MSADETVNLDIPYKFWAPKVLSAGIDQGASAWATIPFSSNDLNLDYLKICAHTGEFSPKDNTSEGSAGCNDDWVSCGVEGCSAQLCKGDKDKTPVPSQVTCKLGAPSTFMQPIRPEQGESKWVDKMAIAFVQEYMNDSSASCGYLDIEQELGKLKTISSRIGEDVILSLVTGGRPGDAAMCGSDYEFTMPYLDAGGTVPSGTSVLKIAAVESEEPPEMLTHANFDACLFDQKVIKKEDGLYNFMFPDIDFDELVGDLTTNPTCSENILYDWGMACIHVTYEEYGYKPESLMRQAAGTLIGYNDDTSSYTDDICKNEGSSSKEELCRTKFTGNSSSYRGNTDIVEDYRSGNLSMISNDPSLLTQVFEDCAFHAGDKLDYTDSRAWESHGNRVCEHVDAPDFGCVPFIHGFVNTGSSLLTDIKFLKTFVSDPFHPCGKGTEEGEFANDDSNYDAYPQNRCHDCSSYSYQHRLTPKQATKLYSSGWKNELCTGTDFDAVMDFYENSEIGLPSISPLFGLKAGGDKIEFGRFESEWQYEDDPDKDSEITFTIEIYNKSGVYPHCGDGTPTLSGGGSGYYKSFEIDSKIDTIDTLSVFQRSGLQGKIAEIHKISPKDGNINLQNLKLEDCWNPDEYEFVKLAVDVDKTIITLNQLWWEVDGLPSACLGPSLNNDESGTMSSSPQDNERFFEFGEFKKKDIICRDVKNIAAGKKNYTGLIIGLVVGGLLLILLLVGGYFYIRRRQERVFRFESDETGTGNTVINSPFDRAADDDNYTYGDYGYDDYDEGYYYDYDDRYEYDY